MDNTPIGEQARAAVEPARRSVRILVWDVPVRVFHWLLAASFAGAYITAESDQWRLAHVIFGYTAAGLACFRIVWGVVGTRHARFASFVRGPRAIASYLGSLLRGQPQHFAGHNPAGALTVIVLLFLSLAVGVSGWATYSPAGGAVYEDVHGVLANLMLIVVGIHIAGVLVSSWLHRENLIAAMITGFKRGDPADGIGKRWRGVGALLLAVVLGFWWWQWQHPASGVAHPERTAVEPGNSDAGD
jgi:cytochrome b